MQLTLQPGPVQSIGILTTAFFAGAEQAQTISPSSLVIVVTGTQVFTTNLPAIWTATSGSIVAAADGLSATYTAPGSPGSATVTATNENDPGDVANSLVTFSGFGPLTSGDGVIGSWPGVMAGRSMIRV
jgi:hypothetical protein